MKEKDTCYLVRYFMNIVSILTVTQTTPSPEKTSSLTYLICLSRFMEHSCINSSSWNGNSQLTMIFHYNSGPGWNLVYYNLQLGTVLARRLLNRIWKVNILTSMWGLNLRLHPLGREGQLRASSSGKFAKNISFHSIYRTCIYIKNPMSLIFNLLIEDNV